MRILLTLTPDGSFGPPRNHAWLQGVLYTAMRQIGFDMVHETQGPKFFCFSSVYPSLRTSDANKVQVYHWQIASPRMALIQRLREHFTLMSTVRFDTMIYRVVNVQEVHLPKITGEVTLRTGTPIYVRIPRHRFAAYGIEAQAKDYVEWTPDYPLNPFVQQLRDNAIKKYKQYIGIENDMDVTGGQTIIWQAFRFLRTQRIRYGKVPCPATHWEFRVPIENQQMRRFVSFLLDCGLGEKNSAGFGFINIA